MFRFIFSRLVQMILVLIVILTATFFMTRAAPGGPFSSEKRISKEVMVNLERYYGLDKPKWQQYFIYMGNVLLHGDLGPSTRYTKSRVNEIIADSFPVSIELGFWSLLIALLWGLLSGIIASLKQNTALDYAPMSFAMVGICIPSFVIGPILILLFAIKTDWFNASGWFFPRDRILPALTLGTYYAAYIARLTRGGMLEILHQDFIRTARAKGASEKQVVLNHALRIALRPVVSFLGPAVAGLLTGSFIVETIFQIPGLGRFFVTSVFNLDFSMIMGTVFVFVYATLILFLNFLVDIIQVWLNPKLRLE
jgi:oligopeptide transport system permease protein